MNPNDNSNDFDQLRKLLALKRYEIPPPRYFNEFSGQVMARLSRPQRDPLTWWQRLGFMIDLKPAFMCGLGVVICGLLSFGIIGAMQISDSDGGLTARDSFSGSSMANPAIVGIAPATATASEPMSMTPLMAQQSTSPFNQFAGSVTPVSFGTFR